jgi:group I intron endonuclease
MEMTDKKWKVYVHINNINNKLYVGITSQSVKARWENGRGYSESPKFWNAIQKYGWDNFEHKVLFDNLCETEAKEIEKSSIKNLNLRDDRFGYNITEGGDGVCGHHHTDETKERLRQIFYNMSYETKMKMIPSGSSSISCICSPIRGGEDGEIGIGSSSETVIGGDVVLFEPTRRWNEVECPPRESALST